jgi:hypothetical protein
MFSLVLTSVVLTVKLQKTMFNHEVEIVVIGKMNLVCKYSPLYMEMNLLNST